MKVVGEERVFDSSEPCCNASGSGPRSNTGFMSLDLGAEVLGSSRDSSKTDQTKSTLRKQQF